MDKCVFCEIVEGRAPAYLIYEDGHFHAFLDTHPRTKGHTLVVPDIHYRWVHEVVEFGKFFGTVKIVADAIRRALRPQWMQFITIGEAVTHAHVHVLPRFTDDQHGSLPDFSKIKAYTDEEMLEIARSIRAEIFRN